MKSAILLACALLLLTAAVLFWWRDYSHPSEPMTHYPDGTTPQSALASDSPPFHQEHRDLPDAYPQLSLRAQSLEAAVDKYIEAIRRDPEYQWKVPIHFFGKVVDQSNNPIAGATAHFEWVNLQGSEGIDVADTITDSEGRFSLEGKRGKNLGVKVSKPGYYDASPYENQLSFEYANPADPTFYEPDPDNPVIFRIRKKGEMEELIVNEVKLDLRGQGATETIDLLTGDVSPADGQLQVTVWKPTITTQQVNTGKVFPYSWRVRIRINSGGLAEHKDPFPFEAPESGYVTEYDATLRPSNGASADVTVNKEFYFYFGQPRKYGRLHFRTDGDRPYVFIDYWLNPSGSRSLEYDASEDDS